MKKICRLGLSCLLITGCLSSIVLKPVYAIDIYYQNKLLKTDVEPVIESGRTLVPVAVIGKAMGATSEWDAVTKKVTITRGDLILHLTLGQKEWGIEGPEGGYTALLDVPAKSINGRTMVPLSAIAEAFGAEVKWDGASRSVLIDSELAKISKSTISSQKDQTITENNVVEKVMRLLIQIHEIDSNKKYDVTDVESFYEMKEAGMGAGYSLAIRDQGQDPELTNMVGIYLINDTGTTLMKYDILNDTYVTIYEQ